MAQPVIIAIVIAAQSLAQCSVAAAVLQASCCSSEGAEADESREMNAFYALPLYDCLVVYYAEKSFHEERSSHLTPVGLLPRSAQLSVDLPVSQSIVSAAS